MKLSGRTLAVAALLMVAAVVIYVGMPGPPVATRARPMVPVTVATVELRSIPLGLGAVGSVEATNSVALKSRVDGEIVTAHFEEGAQVAAGDLLFKIDPLPFEAALRAAEANLARDRAQLQNAERNVARYTELADKGYASRQQFDLARADAEGLAASVRADQAAVDIAKLNLGYTTIRSPIDGVAGARLIHPGNIVKANDTDALVVINQVEPVFVSFALPEQHLPLVRSALAQAPVPVRAIIPGDEDRPADGLLAFIDNAINPGTGTIRMKARFDNRDLRLLPGQFVTVMLAMDVAGAVAAVPSRAVIAGQRGPLVYVVDADDVVAARDVTPGPSRDGMTAITAGLSVGERVVVDGQLRLAPGMKVSPKGEGGGGALGVRAP